MVFESRKHERLEIHEQKRLYSERKYVYNADYNSCQSIHFFNLSIHICEICWFILLSQGETSHSLLLVTGC
jgi:hypothetical protein